MITIESITVVLDPTVLRDPVLDRAKTLARSTGAKIQFLINCHSILDEKSYFSIDHAASGKNANSVFQDVILQSLKNEFLLLDVPITIELFDSADVVAEIVERAGLTGADLVLKSTHHHSNLRKGILTNTDWKLIRQCPIPIWFSKPGAWPARGDIVAAVDPLHNLAEQTRLDSLLIDYAEYYARKSQQTACVYHAFFGSSEPSSAALASNTASVELKRQHNQAVYRLLAYHNIDPANVRIDIGDLGDKLLNYLGNVRSNLLVIGALSRNKLERAIVGSTAEKILDECPCDVLVVKPESGK